MCTQVVGLVPTTCSLSPFWLHFGYFLANFSENLANVVLRMSKKY